MPAFDETYSRQQARMASFDEAGRLLLDIAESLQMNVMLARPIAGDYLGPLGETAGAECVFVALDDPFRLERATDDEFEEPSLKMSLEKVEDEGNRRSCGRGIATRENSHVMFLFD